MSSEQTEFNLFLCSQVTAAPCLACLFNYLFLFMQLAQRLQPFVHYVHHNTVICIAVAISRMDFKALFWAAPDNCWEGSGRAEGCILLGCSHTVSCMGCTAASNGGSKAGPTHIAVYGMRCVCSQKTAQLFLLMRCQSSTLLSIRAVQGITLVNMSNSYYSWVKKFRDGGYFRLSFTKSLI